MLIKTLPLGPVSANCYIIGDGDYGAVIDPGDYNVHLVDAILKSGIKKLEYIICTHGHFDHIAGVKKLKERFPDAKIVIGEGDAPCLGDNHLSAAAFFGMEIDFCNADVTVKDGDVLNIGSIPFRIISMSGHTVGGIMIYSQEQKVAFTGDTLFKGGFGRTDLPGGSHAELVKSCKKIKNLSTDTVLYCGHGESTTVERELKYNVIWYEFLLH
jgi:glyoxylase-like metal-dependent hydrolase (beta-lactamase superfamily II)